MAKAYLTQNKRKGSVGGETYSIVKGQTIVKAKPVSVLNPKTKLQMSQRSLFLDAVRFFQHSNQNFFKLAFEGKMATESDYNAFMRINAKNGVNITKAMGDNSQWPALGNFMVSQGSLTQAQVSYKALHFQFAVSGLNSSDTTIGQLSAALVSAYGLSEGDICTIVTTDSALKSVDASTLLPEFDGTQAPTWTIKQFVIDSASTETIASVLGTGFTPSDNSLGIADPNSTTASGCFVVFSRNTDNGLKVSDANIIINTVGSGIITTMQTSDFVEKVLADWGATDPAILQGSLV